MFITRQLWILLWVPVSDLAELIYPWDEGVVWRLGKEGQLRCHGKARVVDKEEMRSHFWFIYNNQEQLKYQQNVICIIFCSFLWSPARLWTWVDAINYKISCYCAQHKFNFWSVLLNYELLLPHMVIANLTAKRILLTVIVTGHAIPFPQYPCFVIPSTLSITDANSTSDKKCGWR